MFHQVLELGKKPNYIVETALDRQNDKPTNLSILLGVTQSLKGAECWKENLPQIGDVAVVHHMYKEGLQDLDQVKEVLT